ncbi:MAG: hypothetical protein WDN46_09720 [Methylocella sp.]
MRRGASAAVGVRDKRRAMVRRLYWFALPPVAGGHRASGGHGVKTKT